MNPLYLITTDINNLPKILDHYETELKGFKANLELEGKTLELANREQPSWLSFYDQRRLELKSVVKFMEDEVEKTKGQLWKNYTEKYSVALTPRDKDRYICKDSAYLEMRELYLEINELYGKYESIVKAFEARGYALKNITEGRIHAVGDIVL